MNYAVIDISSTSMSLLIYSGETSEVVLKRREGIAAMIFTEKNKLSSQGIEKIVEHITTMQEKCRKHAVDKLFVISTSAMRFIDNASEVFSVIKEKTGCVVNQLDGNTEAYCDYVANRKYAQKNKAVLIDVGGGSIEFCDMSKQKREDMVCLPFGAITLQQMFVKNVFPEEEEYDEIKKYVKRSFRSVGIEKASKYQTCILVGATNNSVYEIYKDYYEIEGEEEKIIEYGKLKKLVNEVMFSSARSHLLIKNAPEKIYFIVTAMAALLQLLKRISPDEIIVSEAGVKEGYIFLNDSGEEKGQLSQLFVERESLPIASVEELTAHIKKNAKASSKKKPDEKKVKKEKKVQVVEEEIKEIPEEDTPTEETTTEE